MSKPDVATQKDGLPVFSTYRSCGLPEKVGSKAYVDEDV